MSAAAEIPELLARQGVRADTLSVEQRARLDEQGYVVLPAAADATWLEALREGFERAHATQRERGDREGGTRHVQDLFDADQAFDAVPVHPALLAAVHHVLGRAFVLHHVSGRDPLPGHGAQGLHTDWMPLAPGEPAAVTTALWMLDDFTEDSGATRVVPGSHRRPGPVPRGQQRPDQLHPRECRAVGAAGDLLVFNGHLWHAGATNRSQRTRRALQLQWAALDRRPPHAERPVLPARLAADARAILGG